MVIFTKKMLLLYVLVSFIFLLILLLIPTKVFAQITPTEEEVQIARSSFTCDSEKIEGISFDYCYRNADSTNNKDIVYFFHPLNGSAATWFTQYLGTLMVQQWWQYRDYKPRIVTISFGKHWLLVNNARFPFLRLFTNSIMPFLEKKMGGLGNGHRHLIGESMGGFSAAYLALKKPGLFSRVALLCPAITTIGPFSSNQEIENYIGRTGAFPFFVNKMLRISRSIFINNKDWDNHNPLTLLKKYNGSNKTKFYVSTGIWDNYGFQEGSEAFYRLARSHSFFSIWIPVPGWHCNFNRINTANFIMGD